MLQSTLTTELPLHDYQKTGVEYVLDRPTHLRRCILGDDMGLGKTLQTIAAVDCMDPYKARHYLVVVPSVAKAVWRKEVEKWLKEDVDIESSSTPLHELYEKCLRPTKRFMIVNYEMLAAIHLAINNGPWSGIIFDEAHKLRNQKTKMSKAAEAICKHNPFLPIFMLTGTPLVNTPGDLYTLLHLLHPKQFHNREHWLNTWFVIGSNGKVLRHRNKEKFQQHIKPFMLRRLRKEVIELPPVRKITVPVELEGSQLKLYNDIKNLWLASLDGQEAISVTNLLAQITRLKQICLAPSLIAKEVSCEGVKLAALKDILENHSGKVVVASCFSSYLRALEKELSKDYKVVCLDGAANDAQRDKAVTDFQEGDAEIFLLSIKAGGVGLTLTAADAFIFMDLPWTAADEEQAFGRIYRIGQEKKVLRYYIRAEGTIEEYIEDVINRKKSMFTDSVPVATVRALFGQL